MAIAQLVTLLAVGLAIIWNQQRGTDKLRDDVNTSIGQLRQDHHKLRDDVNTSISQLRQDHNKLRDDVNTSMGQLRQDHDRLRDTLGHIAQRLARIEGFLGIGIPSADESAGDDQK